MTESSDTDGSVCPVDHKTREAWLEKARAAQPSQQSDTSPPTHLYHPESGRIQHRLPPITKSSPIKYPILNTEREVSSIPRALASTPSSSMHSQSTSSTPAANSEQETGTSPDGRWVYPSEAQFFSAMQRKNQPAQPTDMRSIVPIHNAVNERAWAEILRWEKGRGGAKCGGPKLESFSGLSSSLTPKARWNTWVLGYTAPFDRHDWVVDRCGTRVEYVIDFYEGKDERKEGKPLNFYLDVRPKLNTFEGWKMRIESLIGLS
jgi:cytochrome c heme-lyase